MRRTSTKPKKARESHERKRSTSVTIKLENHIVPVTDVDRAKGFYQQLGWRLDDDVAPMDGLRFVQFTPPGSPASITFGLGLPTGSPRRDPGHPRRLRHRGGP